MRALAESIAGVLAYVDRDERIVFASAGARVLHGLAPEAVVGRTLREISSRPLAGGCRRRRTNRRDARPLAA